MAILYTSIATLTIDDVKVISIFANKNFLDVNIFRLSSIKLAKSMKIKKNI